MKKLIISLFAFQLMMFVVNAQSLDEAKRLLKLANTYIYAQDFDKANANYYKAREIISKYSTWEGKYWDACADETFGHMNLVAGNTLQAQISYENALRKYKKLIRSNEGSPDAIQEILDRIMGVEKTNFGITYKNAKVISLDNTKQDAQSLNLPESVESFSCNNCNLKEFPYDALKSPKIKRLILSNNKIKEFTIQKNNNLELLDLSNNRLKEIGGSFQDLKKLKHLDISGNSLKSIPLGLTELKGLEVLKMTGNKIPFSLIKNLIQSMPNTLIIHDNYILETPESDENIFPGE